MSIAIPAATCRPFAFSWNKQIPGGKCGDLTPPSIGIAATDIIGDVMIILLPMRPIWRLKISRAKKLGLSFVFALGLL